MHIPKIIQVLFSPKRFLLYLLKISANIWPDKIYLKIKYRLMMGKPLNLKEPKTFNEKLQWLKLYNRLPEYTTMVDKYAVKEFVASKIGNEYIIPTLGVWDTPEDIEWEKLPNQFVLKTTHGGGGCGVVICKDKSSFDIHMAKKELQKSLDSDLYLIFREWPYKGVKKRIIAEKYMSDGGCELEDYKVHNFNGVPKVILVCRERFKDTPLVDDFYSDNWEMLDIKRPGHPNSPEPMACPEKLKEMLELSQRLSKDIPFLRTDFYTIENRIYFGELTFYPAAGMVPFEPNIWDEIMGNWIKLPLGGGKVLICSELCYFLVSCQSQSEEDQLKDYKFFCFNGYVRCFKVDFDRFTNHKANYFSRETDLLPFGEQYCPPDYARVFERPENFEKMLEIVECLSQGIPFVRVDLYNTKGRIYFGELTFFPAAGVGKFSPEEWDLKLGEYLTLPQSKIM